LWLRSSNTCLKTFTPQGDYSDLDGESSLQTLWSRWTSSAGQRDIRLFIEVIGPSLFESSGYSLAVQRSIEHRLELLTARLISRGCPDTHARSYATIQLALLRGLMVDMLVTGTAPASMTPLRSSSPAPRDVLQAGPRNRRRTRPLTRTVGTERPDGRALTGHTPGGQIATNDAPEGQNSKPVAAQCRDSGRPNAGRPPKQGGPPAVHTVSGRQQRSVVS
jgi:hypothetical protein